MQIVKKFNSQGFKYGGCISNCHIILTSPQTSRLFWDWLSPKERGTLDPNISTIFMLGTIFSATI